MSRKARRLSHFADPKLEAQVDELVRAQNADVEASEAHEARTDNPHLVTPEQIGAETPAGAQAKVDEHAGQVTGVHGVGTSRVAKTSRADQWPDWADIQGKPTGFPPSAHAATHAAGASDPVTPTAIGAETPSGAQARADLAEANAKAYTDAHAANASLHVTAAYRAAMDNARATPSATNPFVTEETLNNAMTGSAKPGVATLADLAAIPPEQRADKDTRLVEEDGRIYRFDADATSGDVKPNVGSGYWIAVAAATQNHNNLAGIQGGSATERYHLTRAEHDMVLAHPTQNTGIHGVGTAYVAKTSRADQWPDWGDIRNTPSTFTPSAHAATHATGGSDPITPASIGAETPSGAQARVDAHKTATPLDHPDGSVTDAKIGNRTLDQASTPSGNTGALSQLLSWLANRIKALTGKANWYDAPDTTLAAAAAHIAAAAPHSGHETPAGAQAKANAAEANAKAYTDAHAAQQVTSTNAVHGIKQGHGNGLDADKVDGKEPGAANGLATLNASALVAQDSEYRSGVPGFTPSTVKAALDALALARHATNTISAFRALQSSSQWLTGGTFNKVLFGTEVYDQRGEYDPSTSRFTAGEDGVYLFSVALKTGVSTYLALYVNGAEHSGISSGTEGGGSVAVKLKAGDYVEVYCWPASSATTEAISARAFFSGVRLA